MRDFLFSFSQVFSKPRYISLSIVSFFAILTFAIWLPNLNLFGHVVTSNTFSSSKKLSIILSSFQALETNFTLFSAISTLLVSLLFSINLSLFIFFFVRAVRLSKESSIGIWGFLLGILGVGCASCGSVLLSSVLGAAATVGLLGFLPLKGLEFGLLSIILLSTSIYLLSQKIKNPLVCNAKPASFKLLFKAVPLWIKIIIFAILAFVAGLILA